MTKTSFWAGIPALAIFVFLSLLALAASQNFLKIVAATDAAKLPIVWENKAAKFENIYFERALQEPGVDVPSDFPPISLPGVLNDGGQRIGSFSGKHNGFHDWTQSTTIWAIGQMVLDVFHGRRPPPDGDYEKKLRCFMIAVGEGGKFYFERGVVWAFTHMTTGKVPLAKGNLFVFDNRGIVTIYGDQSSATLAKPPTVPQEWNGKVIKSEVDCNRLNPPGGMPPMAPAH